MLHSVQKEQPNPADLQPVPWKTRQLALDTGRPRTCRPQHRALPATIAQYPAHLGCRGSAQSAQRDCLAAYAAEKRCAGH